MRILHLVCLGMLIALTDTHLASAPIINNSGLPIPRFASLKYKEVNLYVGPGREYPIEWTFLRQGLPVQITAEFDIWRRIRDWQGTIGWVPKGSLAGRRTVIVKSASVINMYKNPALNAPVLLRLEPEVIADFITTEGTWCRIKINKVEGWVEIKNLWGCDGDLAT